MWNIDKCVTSNLFTCLRHTLALLITNLFRKLQTDLVPLWNLSPSLHEEKWRRVHFFSLFTTSQKMVSNKINADLQKERDSCSFNVTELTNLIDGGIEKTAERKKRGNLLFNYLFSKVLFSIFNIFVKSFLKATLK